MDDLSIPNPTKTSIPLSYERNPNLNCVPRIVKNFGFFFGFLQNIAGYPNEHRTPPWPSRVIVYGSLTEHRATYTAQNENEEGSATGVRLEEATLPGVLK